MFDPVLHATQGISFCDADTIEKAKQILLPQTHIITPNQVELQQLASAQASESENALALCHLGSNFVFVTGADQDSEQIKNTLYHSAGLVEQFSWQKLPHSFHGSGCTLSSAIACYIALGFNEIEAVKKAQEYTWQALKQADVIGAGQHIPKRM